MRVNLLKERNQAYQINWKEVLVVIIFSLAIIGLGIYYFTLTQEATYLENEKNQLDNQLLTLNRRVAEFHQLEDKVDELEAIEEQMEELRYLWDLALLEKGYLVPTNTMLNSMEIEDRSITINGRAISNQLVLSLIANMELSPIYDEVTLINISRNDDSQFSIEAVITGEGE